MSLSLENNRSTPVLSFYDYANIDVRPRTSPRLHSFLLYPPNQDLPHCQPSFDFKVHSRPFS